MPGSARALVIDLVADVKDFVKGTQEADKALSDFVSDSEGELRKLENVSDGVDFDRIGREAKDAAGDAETAFDNLQREAKKSFGKIEASAKDVDIDFDVDSTKQTFGEAGTEVGAEFASNLGESLASGDLSGVARDTAGGLVSAFAGIAGPIGIGLAGVAATATTIFGRIAAEAAASAERVKTVTASIFDELSSSMTDALGEITRGQAYQDFVSGFSKDGDLADGLRQMQALAKTAGVNVGDIADAFINGGPAAEAMRGRLAKIKTEGTTISANAKGQQTSLSKSATAAGKIAGYMAEADTATANAKESTDALYESMLGATAQARLLEASTSRTSSNLSAAARAASRVRGAPGTVVGGRRLD